MNESTIHAEQYVGIDVSKGTLDVHVLPEGWSGTFQNDDEGRAQLVSKLEQLSKPLVVLEPTGGYERDIVELLVEARIPTAVVNAKQVRHFARALGKHAKTDRIDARCLALFAERVRPEVREMPDILLRELHELIMRRRQLVSMRAAEMSRKHQARGRVQQSICALIDALSEEIKAIEKEISGRIKRSPVWREQDQLLQTATGVAFVVAATLIALMPELGKLSNKKIAALAGLAPFNRDSGKHAGKRKISGGRYDVRFLLVLAARWAIGRDEAIAQLYNRLIKAGKCKMVAIVACARKLLVRLNAMMRKKEAWKGTALKTKVLTANCS